MREKTCCFTGHRQIPPSQYELLTIQLRRVLLHLIENGYCFFGTGGALGFDTLAAQTVLSLKEEHSHIRLILVLPHRRQSQFWPKHDCDVYNEIKQKSDKIVYTSSNYTNSCMFKRNRHLVDASSVCVAYLVKDTGGTAYTVNYAKQQNVPLLYVAGKPSITQNNIETL